VEQGFSLAAKVHSIAALAAEVFGIHHYQR
jgi:hypothetical protein